MVRINLLPVRVSKKKEAGKQQLILFALAIVAGLLANYYWNGSLADVVTRQQAELNNKKAKLREIERVIGEVTSIRADQKALREKLDVLEALKRGRSGPVRMLDELATIIPKRVWLKKLSETGGQLSFEGSAGTIEDVSAFMTALKGSSHFKAVELKQTGRSNAPGARMVDFSIECSVNYTGAPPATAEPGKG